jgi:hypothetical protein
MTAATVLYSPTVRGSLWGRLFYSAYATVTQRSRDKVAVLLGTVVLYGPWVIFRQVAILRKQHTLYAVWRQDTVFPP